MIKILIVDDEPFIASRLSELLVGRDCETLIAETGLAALRMIKEKSPDLVILDVRLPDMNGKEVLRRALEINKWLMVIMLTAYASIEDAVESMKLGAYDYVEKDIELKLKKIVAVSKRSCIEIRDRERRSHLGIQCDDVLGRIWTQGESPAMKMFWSLVDSAASSGMNVVVQGPCVVGKEFTARMIHQCSQRREGPFIIVDCSRYVQEVDFFGRETTKRGGTISREKGYFQLAHEGTLLLYEVHNLPLDVQARLLRTLNTGAVRPVGSKHDIFCEIRIISTTAPCLSTLVEQEKFIRDMYYSLGQSTIRIPLLTQRKEDIPLLARRILQEANARFGNNVKEISKAAMKALVDHPWPGELPELKNVIEGSVLKTKDGQITKKIISSELVKRRDEGSAPDVDKSASYREKMESYEYTVIKTALDETGGNLTKAAEILNMSITTLFRKKEKHGL